MKLRFIWLAILPGCHSFVVQKSPIRPYMRTARNSARLVVVKSIDEERDICTDPSTSSIAKSTFNLAKTIMGAGAISLPGSITAIGDGKFLHITFFW